MNKIQSSGKYSMILVLVLAGESIFFLPFVLARIFRPTFLRVLDITNMELGACFSAYGIVAMVSYFFGGFLADRFSARLLIALGLWSTALGGLVLALIPSKEILVVLYGFWGLTTIFVFWSALIRATREWGEDEAQGRAFGFLESGRGLMAALLGVISVILFSSDHSSSSVHDNRSFGFIVYAASAITFVSGLLVWKILPGSKLSNRKKAFRDVRKVSTKPVLWLNAIIVICAYVGYKITDDLSLYANEVLGFSEVESAYVGTGSLWLRPIFALLAGLLADRISASRVVVWAFAVICCGALIIVAGVQINTIVITLIVMATIVAGIYGLRGVYFALVNEGQIPLPFTGTAVGIISVLGFLPDVFMSPWMGYLLDNNPGVKGHQMVFAVLLGFSILGAVVAVVFRKVVDEK